MEHLDILNYIFMSVTDRLDQKIVQIQKLRNCAFLKWLPVKLAIKYWIVYIHSHLNKSNYNENAFLAQQNRNSISITVYVLNIAGFHLPSYEKRRNKVGLKILKKQGKSRNFSHEK